MEEVEFQEMYVNFTFHTMNHCAWLPQDLYVNKILAFKRKKKTMMALCGILRVVSRLCGFHNVYSNKLSGL